ncbi:hypothetical protein AVEN_83169-1 [Araneus ventricosus]|uniref:Uncharacterized protein n=1 Tax=Araneus ventricosus TaxID=182803 RepID=A0A4Y2AQ09_ARAVE|nr:hypothetical protein AVEN_83169-1 [Araneus ventricosus]
MEENIPRRIELSTSIKGSLDKRRRRKSISAQLDSIKLLQKGGELFLPTLDETCSWFGRRLEFPKFEKKKKKEKKQISCLHLLPLFISSMSEAWTVLGPLC